MSRLRALAHRISRRRFIGAAGAASALLTLPAYAQNARLAWKTLEPGLDFAQTPSPLAPDGEDGVVSFLRVDPRRYRFSILTARGNNDARKSPGDWARQFRCLAAINAGMYLKDYRTSVGYLRAGDLYVNPTLGADRTVAAFNGRDRGVPPFQIIDRTCQNFKALEPRYESLLQSIRLIDCNRRNVWKPDTRKWSIAALGADKTGRAVFVHVKAPHMVHDFVNLLLALPLDLRNAMYLEGGREAALYVNAGGVMLEKTGLPRSDSLFGRVTTGPVEIPNVIGVLRRG
ncbi:MAG: phosphodiester glycosidase family protein [Alphaproteobacteria bacterium]